MSTSITKKEIETSRDIFVNSALSVRNIFLEDNISLAFQNYKQTLIEYLNSSEYDIETLHSLIKDVNLWYQYFCDLEGLTQMIFFKKQNMKAYIDAFPKTPKNQAKSKELSTQIIRLKLFLKQIKIQKKMFSNISQNCLDMYNNAYEHYLYRY